jgi:hypothetical protein
VRKWATWRVMVASRPKVSFLSGGSTSPGNYGWFFEYVSSDIQMKEHEWIDDWFVCNLMKLFQLDWLFSIKWDEKMVMNSEEWSRR